ncbi:exodeoxyribonuclease VII small subunit [Mariniblastus sp.]|nr:exodeoxyribonuclease VII small subunit [Mariniblastus sp.]
MAKKKTTRKSKSATNAIPFEQSLEQLKQVVAELETGNLTLTESLEKYQQGIANLKQCHASLENAKKQIEILVDLDEDGNLQTQTFDDSASSQGDHGVRRSTAMKSQTTEVEDFDLDDEDDEYEEEDDDGLF